MADEMIELMDLSKVAKRSWSERRFTQREHFLLDQKGLKYTFINLSCFCRTAFCVLPPSAVHLRGFFLFFRLVFFGFSFVFFECSYANT